MWEGKMTQEEEDLEELSSLEIREDHGAEDSDVTPINTPPSTPPILYIKKYPPAIPPEVDETKTFQKLSRREDDDCRSESSLSWGDDEFEGEATKQVSLLFDQVDNLLYGEDHSPPSVLPSPEVLPGTVASPFYNSSLSTPSSEDSPVIELPDITLDTVNIRTSDSSSKDLFYGLSLEKGINDDNQSEKFFSSGKFHGSKANFSSDEIVVSDPPPELNKECRSWVHRFPHYRVRGYSVDPTELEKSQGDLFVDDVSEEESEEEVIAYDGEFEHLLPLVVYTCANQVKILPKENSKHSSPSSRVCSGSNDPEVLKEQVLIGLFDRIWESVTKTVDPLLHQYARYVIEQSVQYMSISREPSTRGNRASAQRIPQNASDDIRTKNKFLNPLSVVDRPFTGRGILPSSRPSSGIRRPRSAVQRLNKSVSIPDIHHHEELHDLLQVSTKPLQNGENRVRSYPSSTTQTREGSASSRMSQLSLPSVITPRDTSSRPISSKSTSRHFTPVKTIMSSTTLAEQRPASTSSYNTRMRIHERFQHLNRQYTIQELGSDNTSSEADDAMTDQPSPVWSRHIPFLPPICDNAVIPLKLHQPPGVAREKGQSALYVKGTLMSASHHPDGNKNPSKSWISGMKPVEPFLSWVVEKVDNNKTQLLRRNKHQVVENSLVNGDSKSNSLFTTKHYRRYSHH